MKTNQIDRLHINEYNLDSYFCREKFSKGGVMIFSKRGIVGKKVLIDEADSLCEEKLFEFCSVMFKVNKVKIIVVGVYRSPQADVNDFLNRLNQLIHCLSKRSSSIIVAGDVNIDTSKNSKENARLNHVLKSHKMVSLVDFVTRVFNGAESAIDNVFTNIDRDKIKVNGIITMLSDHDGQLIELSPSELSKNNNKFFIEKRRKFSKENIKTFVKLIGAESWGEVYVAPVNEKFNVFNQIFQYYFEMCFPQVTIKLKNNKGNRWISENLKKEKREIINLNNHARKSQDWDLLKLARKKTTFIKKS